MDTVNIQGENLDEQKLQQIKIGVQEIIDKYLPEEKRFSVLNMTGDEVMTIIDLLTGEVSWNQLEDKMKTDEISFLKTTDKIFALNDYQNKIEENYHSTKNALSSLQSDINLEIQLDF